MRVRWLKSPNFGYNPRYIRVALHASALIEINKYAVVPIGGNSRTPCECVDWNDFRLRKC